eukprot:1206158-Rhodomonas_salina.1
MSGMARARACLSRTCVHARSACVSVVDENVEAYLVRTSNEARTACLIIKAQMNSAAQQSRPSHTRTLDQHIMLSTLDHHI